MTPASRVRPGFFPVAVLGALPLVLYAPFLVGGKVLYWGAYLLQFLPWRQLAVEQIRAGHWPHWNPFLGAGTPLAANLQTAAFYPPNVLFLLLPVERAFGWSLALHVALAGLFAYVLGRTLGLSRLGALVTGLAYGGGGYMVAHWVFPSMACAIPWLPLLVALTERLVRGGPTFVPTIVRIALLALAVALQLLAGHAQTSFYSLLIVVAYAFVRSRREPSGLKLYGLRLAGIALAIALGLALAAIQLLPTAELALHSQRSGAVLADEQFAFELSFWPPRLLSLAAPDMFGNPARGEYLGYGTYWEEAAYVGVLPLMLAAAALAAWVRRRREGGSSPLAQVPFFALLALVSLLLALGNHTPLYPLLFRTVPGFGLFQAPARMMLGYALGMAVLGGIGLDALRATVRRQRTLRLTLVAGVGLAAGSGAARLAAPDLYPTFSAGLARLGLLLAASAGVLLAQPTVARKPTRHPIWQASVALLLLADLLWFGVGLAPGVDAAAVRAPSATAGFLQSQPPGRVLVMPDYAQRVYEQTVNLRRFGQQPAEDVRLALDSLHPNLNALYGLPAVANYDPLQVGRMADLWARIEGDPEDPLSFQEIRPLLNLMGVRYLVTDEALPLPRIYDQGPNIYRNDAALPAAFLVPHAWVVNEAEARLALLADPGFDPREVLLLEGDAGSMPEPLPAGAEASQTEVAVLREGPNRVTIQVNAEQAGVLVLTDTTYPGWAATVDGKPAEVLVADHAFRAVEVEAGGHSVELVYRRASFHWGEWVTVGAAILLLPFLIARILTGEAPAEREA